MERIKIFYADDDADDVFFFRNALESLNINFNLEVFHTGQAMIDHITTVPVHPDIIFLDINMPLKNGLQCLQEIKANTEISHIPIFMLSTSDSEVSKKQALSLGAKDYICKPNSFEALKTQIGEAIETA